MAPSKPVQALRGLILGAWLVEQHRAGKSWEEVVREAPDPEWEGRRQEVESVLQLASKGHSEALNALNKLEQWLQAPQASVSFSPELSDFYYDILVLQVLGGADSNAGSETDFLDDPAWDRFEEACLGKGTDLLHLLHYVDECLVEGVTASMDDFIDSFVLSPELEDQDNLLAYEEVLASRDLIHEPVEEMLEECRAMAKDSAIEPVLTGLFCFLRRDPPAAQWLPGLWAQTAELGDVLPVLFASQAYYGEEALGAESWLPGRGSGWKTFLNQGLA
jgi:hypothetical protein